MLLTNITDDHLETTMGFCMILGALETNHSVKNVGRRSHVWRWINSFPMLVARFAPTMKII